MTTSEKKYQALFEAPMHWPLLRPETQIIVRPGWYQVITPTSKSASDNEIYVSEVEGEVAAIVAQVTDQYRAHGSKFKWCVGPWTKPTSMNQILESLASASWDVVGMACETNLDLGIPIVKNVEEVTPTNLSAYLEAFAAGWDVAIPDVEAAKQQIERSFLLPSQPVRFYVAFSGATPVGTASYTIKKDYAYLAGGNVLPAFRGKNIYKGLIAARLNDLAARGIRLAVTHARKKTSAPILNKLGFESVFTYKIYELS